MQDFPFNSPARIDAILREHEGGIRKRWGQNFLTDPNHARIICEHILAGAREQGAERVAEIGPGLGALTHRLLTAGLRVDALEIDPIMARILREHLGTAEFAFSANLEIHEGDARDILPGLNDIECVCGNLPYYISTELITTALTLPRLRAAVFLTQLEFAERAAAQDAASSLSVYLGNFGAWKIVHRVPPGAFHPAPSVHSALVAFRAHEDGPHVDGSLLERYLRASFASRRKKIRNSWKHARFPDEEFQALLDNAEALGLDPDQRAEQWPRRAYYDLARRMGAL